MIIKEFSRKIILVLLCCTVFSGILFSQEDDMSWDELNKLTIFCYEIGSYYEALEFALKALFQAEKEFGNTTLEYAKSLQNLAVLYETMGKYSEAESLYMQAIEICKILPPVGKHPIYTASLDNLGRLYSIMGRYNDAEPLLKLSIDIRKSLFPEGKNPDYETSLHNLAVLYLSMGKYEEAEPYLINSITIYTEFIKNNLYTLNETEKAQLYSTIDFSFENFYTFLEKGNRENTGQLRTMAYDIQLFNKAMLFDSTKKMIEQIRNSKDSELIEILNQWLTLRDQLAKEYKDQKAQKANELEKMLAEKSQDFSEEKEKLGYTWKDIKASLKKNEAAIEIVGYRVFETHWANTVHYAVLILKKASKYPEIIFLKNGNEMENELLKLYNKTM